jgi:hypothetical protein
MPTYCEVICCVPEDWTLNKVVDLVGLENVDPHSRFHGDSSELGGVLVAFPYPLTPMGERVDSREVLNVSEIAPKPTRYVSTEEKVLLEGVNYPRKLIEILFWPPARDMLRPFLRLLCQAEPRAKFCFYSGVISARAFLRLEAVLEDEERKNKFNYGYDPEEYFTYTFPIPEALKDEIEVRRADPDNEDDPYSIFDEQGLRIFL